MEVYLQDNKDCVKKLDACYNVLMSLINGVIGDVPLHRDVALMLSDHYQMIEVLRNEITEECIEFLNEQIEVIGDE